MTQGRKRHARAVIRSVMLSTVGPQSDFPKRVGERLSWLKGVFLSTPRCGNSPSRLLLAHLCPSPVRGGDGETAVKLSVPKDGGKTQ